MKLGKVNKVELRSVWRHEERDFNKWLAKDGLKLLAEKIGLADVEVKEVEANAGDFYVDILATVNDISGEKIMVIESQLEKTDHNHLGKVLTYAASYDATYVVWICSQVRDEHREVIDWLNSIAESSDKEIYFFLVQIELWKIDNSPPAPVFNVISSPNYWKKSLKRTTSQTIGEMSKIALNFLNKLYENLREKRTIRPPTPSTPSYYFIPIGTSKAGIRVGVSVTQKYIRVGLVFKKELMEKFKAFETEFLQLFKDDEVKIESPEQYKSAYADIFLRKVDFLDEGKLKGYIDWASDKIERLETFVKKHRRELFMT